MKKAIVAAAVLLLSFAVSFAASGPKRVEISPAMLVNLGSGHSGEFMGGAITGDVYFTDNVAFRSTIGFTRDRYYPSELDYSNADYSFWLSMAPYVELNVGNTWKPYLAFLGSFGVGSASTPSTVGPIGMNQSPYARVQPVTTRDAFYSFGGSVGSKIRLAGPVSLFAEVSHIFYTSFSERGTFYATGEPYLDQSYSLRKNPTYLSVGLSYTLDIARKK